MTLTPVSFGLQLERFFHRVLRAGGIRQAENDFTPQTLLLDAQVNDPRRLERVRRHVDLNAATAADVLDHVYGIDHLIDVNGVDGEPVYAAIDLTANSAAVASKLEKAHSLRKLWAGIGVAQFFIVHLDGDPSDLTAAGRDELIESLWEQLELAFNGPVQRTHVVRLTIR